MTEAALLTLPTMTSATEHQLGDSAVPPLDEESREWLRCLRAEGSVKEEAVARLHALLLRAAWQGREVPLEPEDWSLLSSAGLEPDQELEQSELLTTLQRAVAEVLTPHQRRVLVALALNGVPIDVLAERLGTTRGALYKTLHDARRKLRRHLDEEEL